MQHNLQQQNAKALYSLHHTGKMLVLPNVWDALGALLLRDIGYNVIATASAAIAYTNGVPDGEHISFDDLVQQLKKITAAVTLPVTADIETGYADNDEMLRQNIKRLIETGIAGVNIEDTDKTTGKLLHAEVMCHKIQLVNATAAACGTTLFVNARTDVILHGKDFASHQEKIIEISRRGILYKQAGAGCFFPIALKNKEDIAAVMQAVQMPVNIFTIPGIPALEELNNMGVARLSLGPAFLKYAMQAMKKLAVNLQHYQGLEEITNNEISSDYLKKLVNK